MSRGSLAAVLLLTAAGAAIRLPALAALPIFGDEAIILRVAKIVRSAPLEHLWIPLRIPYAPLHEWLLALALPISADPVVAGRLLSVLFGVLLVGALGIVVDRIGRAYGSSEDAGPWAAALVAVSPFLVFSDRVARPDSLFAFQTVLAAGLSVLIACRPRPLLPAIGFGVLMGLTMLTRQAVSYPLWLLPIVAFACRRRRDWGALVLPLFAAAVIAAILWGPMLVVPGWPPLADRIFHVAGVRPPLSLADRGRLFAHNVGIVAAAFWTYFTPPIFIAGLAGFGILAATRRRLFAFLAAWELLLLLPPIPFAGDYFPRYAVPAAPAFLAAAAFAVARVWGRAKRWARPALLVAVFAWPAIDAVRSVADWRSGRLLPIDRVQFVSGWSAGLASQRAAGFLSEAADSTPITVIVPHVSGNPSDAVWLLLEGNRNVHLRYARDFLSLPALDVKGDVWIGGPAATLDPDRPAYFVTQDPAFLGRAGWTPASRIILPLNPAARRVARFGNPPDEHGRNRSAVEVYRIR
jgi:4-amino-4-deoxy-L-arabinose transferase-like glycosyltransferase